MCLIEPTGLLTGEFSYAISGMLQFVGREIYRPNMTALILKPNSRFGEIEKGTLSVKETVYDDRKMNSGGLET